MKTCSKCKAEKPLTEFHKDKSERCGFKYMCKVCTISRSADYYKKNCVKVKGKTRAFWAANRSIALARGRESKKARAIVLASNPLLVEAERIREREAFKRDCESLSDGYIKTAIRQNTGIPTSSITKELIEVKRLHLQIIRKLKELKA